MRDVGPNTTPPLLGLGTEHILQLLYEPPGAFTDLQIDLLLAESDYHREALSRRVPMRLPELDMAVLVLSCEDLIIHKLIAGRIIDKADVVALLRANKEGLDLDYLWKWVQELALEQDWSMVWGEAFPGIPWK